MKIKYEVTLEDLEEYAVFFMVNNKFGNLRYNLLRILAGAAPFIFLSSLWAQNPPYAIWSSPKYVGGAVVLSVGLVLVFSWLMKWSMKLLYRRMLVGDYAKGIIGWHERVLTDTGIDATSDVAKSSTNWEGIKGVQITERFSYIWVGPNVGWVVPKERVAEGNYDTFKEELKRLFEKNRPGMKVETIA